MSKQFANQGLMLNKNMTHTETLIVNTPSNPKEGFLYQVKSDHNNKNSLIKII